MPWARLTHERINTVYKKLLDNFTIQNRKPELVVREMLIRVEILKRDFTKRQLTILSAIVTFSFFYGKELAIIPKLRDFQLAGISQTKIKTELTQLVDLGVISWNRGKDYNEFSIKDPREWKAAYHAGYNDYRSRELFILNLKHSGITTDLDDLIKKVLTDT